MPDNAKRTATDPASADELKTGSLAPATERRPLERVLGAHVRRLRRQQDLSIGDLAQAAGISSGMLSKFENGQISPSLTKLQAIAGALGLQMSSLLAESEERRDCSYVQNGQGVIIDRRGTKAGHLYRLLGHGLRADVIVEPYLIELREDAIAYPHFKHAGTEFIYMLSGCVAYRHGEVTYELRTGDAILFDSFAHHGPEAFIELPATYLSVIIYSRDQN